MGVFNRAFAIRIAATAAAAVMSAAFAQAQIPGEAPAAAHGDLQRTADLVNLMRTVFDPAPAPVLVSPADRAVSGKTSADPASPVVAATPVVILPAIAVPDAAKQEKAEARTEPPPRPDATADDTRKKDAPAAKPDTDQPPEFYYAFFFGDYVPYYNGWFYYSDAWLWGGHLPRPAEPPGWIPPPPPPRPLDPFLPVFPDGLIPFLPGLYPVPGRIETGIKPPGRNDSIPVSPEAHRIPRRNR